MTDKFNYDVLEEFYLKYGKLKSKYCNPKKCYKFFLNQKNYNDNAVLKLTFKYIEDFYSTKRQDKNLLIFDEIPITDYLLHRFNKLEKGYKYSFSINSSAVISFIISLVFAFLQMPDKDGNSYFSFLTFLSTKAVEFINISPNPTVISAMSILIILFFVPFVYTLFFAITTVNSLYYINSTFNNIVIPYERQVVIETLATYDEKYISLK